MSSKTGLCINVGNCINADSKMPLEVSVAADFSCPECGRELVAKEDKSKNSKALLFAAIVLGAIVSCVSYYFVTKTPDQNSTTSEGNTTVVVDEGKLEAKPDETEANVFLNNDTIQVNKFSKPKNIQECVGKLTSTSLSYSEKDFYRQSFLQYFQSPISSVITVGQNNTEVNDMSAEDFSEMLRSSNQKFQVIKSEKSGSKFSKLFVKGI